METIVTKRRNESEHIKTSSSQFDLPSNRQKDNGIYCGSNGTVSTHSSSKSCFLNTMDDTPQEATYIPPSGQLVQPPSIADQCYTRFLAQPVQQDLYKSPDFLFTNTQLNFNCDMSTLEAASQPMQGICNYLGEAVYAKYSS